MSGTGLGTMLRVQLRTGWTTIALWAVGITAVIGMSLSALFGSYDTDAKIATYATSIAAAGDATFMMGGRIAGIDTLGGIIAAETSFLVGIGIPLMAITLVSRFTRKEEEAGRWELLLTNPVGRTAPLAAAVVIGLGALAVVTALVALMLILGGVDAPGAVLHAAGAFGLGAVFVGLASLFSQVFAHSRAVLGAGFVVLLLAYVTRGLGAVHDNVAVWFSPLGWSDSLRPYGDARVWPLAISWGVAATLVVVSLVMSGRRDVGAALVRPRPGPSRAGSWLRSEWGLAARLQRGGILAWTLGAAVLMAVFGTLAEVIVNAVKENADLGGLFNGDASASLNPVIAMYLMFLALLVAAFGVSAAGVLQSAETSGRLELRLAVPLSRWRWLGVHLITVILGMVTVWGAGAVALAVAAGAVTDDAELTRTILGAAPVYLPGAMLVAAVPVALFGVLPRVPGLAWGIYAVTAAVSYLGGMLDLPDWLVDSMPFTVMGAPPTDDVKAWAVWLLVGMAVLALSLGFVGLARRDTRQAQV